MTYKIIVMRIVNLVRAFNFSSFVMLEEGKIAKDVKRTHGSSTQNFSLDIP